jgi:hypothetical protein
MSRCYDQPLTSNVAGSARIKSTCFHNLARVASIVVATALQAASARNLGRFEAGAARDQGGTYLSYNSVRPSRREQLQCTRLPDHGAA